MKTLRLIVTMLVCGTAAAVIAQTPASTPAVNSSQAGSSEVSPGDVLKINTRFVRVPFTVIDRKGAAVPKLAQEHFHVFEDGVEQTIASFESLEQPLTAVLLLDTSPSTRFRLADIKKAAIAFVDKLRPNDQLMVVTFSDQVRVLTELTSDLDVARSAVKSATEGNNTRLYDAIEFVNERLKTIQGRKAVVVLTDGIDNASWDSTAENTLYTAEESDLVVYSLQYDTFREIADYVPADMADGIRKTTEKTYPPGLGPKDYERATKYLKDLAARSGGRFYHADDMGGIKRAFTLIGDQLRGQYMLAYYPKTNSSEKQRHDINVRVDRPNLVVKARRNYIR
jgi:Ca-activated chloride channel family protein